MMSNSRGRYEQEDLQGAADLIERCIRWVPKDRISAADALDHPFLAS